MAGTGSGKGGHFRASDADREQVIDTLKTAFVQGRLTKDELDARVGQTFASKTYAELAAVTADIPAGPARARARARAGTASAKKTIAWGLGGWAGTSAALIGAGILTANESVGLAGLVLGFLFVLVTMAWAMIAVGTMVDARLKNPRSRGQLPPGPRGPGVDDHETGRHLARPEVRRDETGAELRARSPRRDRDPKTPKNPKTPRMMPAAGLV